MSGVVSAGGDYHILDIYCQQLWNALLVKAVNRVFLMCGKSPKVDV